MQFGHFLFTQGRLDDAREQYESALEALPGYVHATAGHARIAAAIERYDEAISLYSAVVERQPVLEYVAALGDVYRAAGREADAQRQYDLVGVIDELYKANGINTDTELAIFFANHHSGEGSLEEAVTQAQAAYAARPASITAADALSWVLYKAGRYDEALVYSKEAVRLGTNDPLLLFHAGIINFRAGNDDVARDYLTRATDANPRFSVLYADEAAAALAELNATVEGHAMSRRTLLALALAAPVFALIVAGLTRPESAAAHPLGNFTVNRYSRLELYSDAIRVRYVLDMAEIPAFQEIGEIDSDGDGEPGPTESEAYLDRKTDDLASNLNLSVNGSTAALELLSSEITYPEGQAGLKTLRIELLLESSWLPIPMFPSTTAMKTTQTAWAGKRSWCDRPKALSYRAPLPLVMKSAQSSQPTRRTY